jgi:hypothetical protein
MAAANKVNVFSENLAEKVHNLGSDVLKWLLTNTAPTSASAVKADLTEITAANGYPAGGLTPTISSSAQTSGTYKLVLADATLTAAGGSVGPFRYAVLYNDTPTSPADPIVLYYDYGSSITLADTESFVFDADPTNGVLQLA